MNVNEIQLSRNGISLVVSLLFCLLLGGFFVGTDLYHYNDPESALTVVMLYGLMGLLGSMFLFGKKYGPIGLVVISGFLLIAQMGYVIAFVSGMAMGPGFHDPSANWFITGADIVLSLLVLAFSFKVYKENQ